MSVRPSQKKDTRTYVCLFGGERALTLIALLFAHSQVNPPPFIIFDETDAARLDGANSKKYGDMIENLSKYSQLILITHNRETISRAGIIYGVTMGIDGISKLLYHIRRSDYGGEVIMNWKNLTFYNKYD